jgi:hypothetical protein
MVSANSNQDGNASVTITDSSGLTWIPLAEVYYPSYSGVWIAQVPVYTAALTVSPVFAAAARVAVAGSLAVVPVLGAQAGSNQQAALTVSPVLGASGTSGPPARTAALTVTPSLGLQADAGKSAALTIVPSFTVARSRRSKSNSGLLMAAGII